MFTTEDRPNLVSLPKKLGRHLEGVTSYQKFAAISRLEEQSCQISSIWNHRATDFFEEVEHLL